MKVLVPDPLMEYERQVLCSLLESSPWIPVFAQIDFQAEAILTGSVPVGIDLLGSLPQLRGIVRFARGRHDLTEEQAFCRSAGVKYFLISGASAPSTAEHTVMLALALLRQLPRANRAMRSGHWCQKEIAQFGIRDLSSVTVGLVGLGRVGKRVATLVKTFGARVVYSKPHRLSAAEEARWGVTWMDLETLLHEADVVSLHARAPDTEHPILDKRHVAMLKVGAVFINTGDGRHVDLEAVLERVRDGTLAAGLDVFASEPWTPPAECLTLESSYLFTPHIAGRSQHTARELFSRACAALGQLEEPRAPARVTGSQHMRVAGPVLRRVLGILAPKRPLEGCTVRIGDSVNRALPSIGASFEMLGCRQATCLQPSPSLISLETSSGSLDFLFELPSPSGWEDQDVIFSTAAIPALSFLVERWQLDYLLWDHLLPRAARGSLPGRVLLVFGYGRRGRSVAWRAREIGMRVLVAEKDLKRWLNASHDGFETFSGEAPPDYLVVHTEPSETSEGLNPFVPLTSIPAGLVDECTALGLIASYVVRTLSSRQEGIFCVADAVRICSELLLDAVASERIEDHVSSSALWAADGW